MEYTVPAFGMGSVQQPAESIQGVFQRAHDAFCDGRSRVMSDNMAFTVYAALMTSGGSARRGQVAIGDNQY
jgi:hypothetical protein